MTQRSLGIASGGLAAVFLLTWIAAGLMSVVAGIGPREAMSLAVNVQAVIETEGLVAVRETPLRPVGTTASTRVVVTDTEGTVVASWPEDLVGKRLELRAPENPSLAARSGQFGVERWTAGAPTPQVATQQQGRWMRTETGRILFGRTSCRRGFVSAFREGAWWPNVLHFCSNGALGVRWAGRYRVESFAGAGGID